MSGRLVAETWPCGPCLADRDGFLNPDTGIWTCAVCDHAVAIPVTW